MVRAAFLALFLTACAKPTPLPTTVDMSTWAVPPPGPAQACDAAPPPGRVDPRALTPTPLPEGAHPALTDPSLATETAPDQFWIRFETTAGTFLVEVHREWSPYGADRIYNLARIGFYDGGPAFRVIPEFMAQFGLSASAAANQAWADARFPDDPVKLGNKRGVLVMAKCGMPDCRTTQMYINLVDNDSLDPMGFSGIGVVVEGMEAVDALYACYGEGAPYGRGPSQDAIRDYGVAVIDAGWPQLSRIVSATVIEGKRR